jgi:hypothetical protein
MPIKILIIVQSPADLADAILISQNIVSCQADFAIIGSVGIKNVLSNYNNKIIFFNPPAFSKGLVKYVYSYVGMKSKYRKFIYDYDEIYYPDLLNDLFSSALVVIAKSLKIKTIKYTNRYDSLIRDDLSNKTFYNIFKSKLIAHILQLITGVKDIKVIKYNKRFLPYCNFNPDIFYHVNNTVFLKKNIQLAQSGLFKKNYLFLDPGPGIFDLISDYNEVILPLLVVISQNGNLFIKKHPTHPLSLSEDFIDKGKFSVFDEILPINMINLSVFDCVIGIDSLGLSEVCDSFSISLIKLFKLFDVDFLNIYINYLNSNSIVEVFFPNSLDLFYKYLKIPNKTI